MADKQFIPIDGSNDLVVNRPLSTGKTPVISLIFLQNKYQKESGRFPLEVLLGIHRRQYARIPKAGLILA